MQSYVMQNVEAGMHQKQSCVGGVNGWPKVCQLDAVKPQAGMTGPSSGKLQRVLQCFQQDQKALRDERSLITLSATHALTNTGPYIAGA